MANRKVRLAKQTVFALKRGVSIGGVGADIIGQELLRIATAHGALTTDGVVNEARPDHAPLHPAFEWDDSSAGELYRKIQARNMIRAVEIVKPDNRKTQAYVHIPSQEPTKVAGHYELMTAVVNQPDKFVIALSALKARVNSAQQALDDLQAAAQETDIDQDRMAALTLAAMAMSTAHDAILRIQ